MRIRLNQTLRWDGILIKNIYKYSAVSQIKLDVDNANTDTGFDRRNILLTQGYCMLSSRVK